MSRFPLYKKKKKKCRLTMIHYTFPCNLHRKRKRATTLILSSCPSVYTPSRTLCSSSDEKTLSCAKWKLKGFGHRSFSVQAPRVWNNLPPHIRHNSSLSQFKISLGTSSSLVPSLSYLDRLEDFLFHSLTADVSVRAFPDDVRAVEAASFIFVDGTVNGGDV